jgi:hypothetical protein
LEASSPPKIRRSDSLMLIQSGAMIPDSAMLDEVSRYFAVAPAAFFNQ